MLSTYSGSASHTRGIMLQKCQGKLKRGADNVVERQQLQLYGNQWNTSPHWALVYCHHTVKL